MKYSITLQDEYSRGDLLIKTFFGAIYIGIPHGFLLFFVSIWGQIQAMIAFYIVLFTGKYPESMFEYQVKLMKWTQRLVSHWMMYNEGYPQLGLDGESDKCELEVPYPESISRGGVILRALFGAFYCLLPHGFVLYFRFLVSAVMMQIAWLSMLFTGKYPEGMHSFVVGTYRWAFRVQAYMGYLTDEYPPFTGKE